ncbi:MAG: ABC transporter ATP-binding protein [Actinobacteria bacterium]|nr:ABC transporter ATP-binding protein [Actinomycetota bacterium]
MTDPVAPPEGTPLLEVEDLSVVFRGRQGTMAGLLGEKTKDARAVDGVDLQVGRGEIVALAGESGCGKTTLARAILGLVPPSTGRIKLDGTEVPQGHRALRKFRRRVQLVFQDPAGTLDPRQTVYEAVAEGIRNQALPGDEEKRVRDALSQAGLRPPDRFYLRFPHELSGGQRQRVIIAGALALQPDLIVADEPVSALDASVRGEILRLLLELREQRGLALLIVTHDLGVAWMVADRVAVMYLGRIVEVGRTEAVLTNPQHPYTRSLLSVVPETKHVAPMVLSGEAPDPTRIPSGCRFHPRCPMVADGTAAAAGIEERCRNEDPSLAGTEHEVACHLVDAPAPRATPAGS